MAAKVLIVLALVGACVAFPTEEIQPPASLAQPSPPADSAAPEHKPAENAEQTAPTSEQDEKDDLKTENTYWWRRSYYPSHSYYRSYPRYYSSYSYYPRSYSSYSYYHPYSSWGSWW